MSLGSGCESEQGKKFVKPEFKACIEEFKEKLNKFLMEKKEPRRNRKKRSGSYRESQEHGISCCHQQSERSTCRRIWWRWRLVILHHGYRIVHSTRRIVFISLFSLKRPSLCGSQMLQTGWTRFWAKSYHQSSFLKPKHQWWYVKTFHMYLKQSHTTLVTWIHLRKSWVKFFGFQGKRASQKAATSREETVQSHRDTSEEAWGHQVERKETVSGQRECLVKFLNISRAISYKL